MDHIEVKKEGKVETAAKNDSDYIRSDDDETETDYDNDPLKKRHRQDTSSTKSQTSKKQKISASDASQSINPT